MLVMLEVCAQLSRCSGELMKEAWAWYAVLTSSWKVVPRVASASRAKSMKLKDWYMISSGQPVNEYIGSAVRHVLLRQKLLVDLAFKFG
ncbi:hypothetical protein C5167_021659 [Papaver somniferum]|nr:hypothetical protein C5167_021659 [Papaver somniferum]